MSTPRTDEREKTYWETPTSHVDDVWEFARQLERENAALKIERNRCKVALQDIASASTGWARERAQMQLRKEVQP